MSGNPVASQDVAPSTVVDAYDYTGPVIARYWGQTLHFGFWDGPDDRTPFAAAADRLTQLVAEQLTVGPGAEVLDVGCGNGKPAIDVATITGARVTGVDLNPRELEAAEGLARSVPGGDRVTFQVGDALALPLPDDSVDAAMAIESSPHIPLDPMFTEIARVLRPGGRFVVATQFARKPVVGEAAERMATLLEVWQVRAFNTLEEHVRALAAAELDLHGFADLTKATQSSFPRLAAALRTARTGLAEEFGADKIARLIRAVEEYDQPEMGYLLLTAVKPKPFRPAVF